MKFSTTQREPRFSNHPERDAAIMTRVADALTRRGHSEVASIHSADVVLLMWRGEENLQRLTSPAVNSPQAVRNCRRNSMMLLLQEAGIPVPDFVLNPTADPAFGACWVKRADSHTMGLDDVTFAPNWAAAQAHIARLNHDVILCRHIPGTVVKFYGLVDDSFFHCTPAVDAPALRRICMKAAEALGEEVFGGDAIITPQGDIKIIDINDWPTFAPCRQEAAEAIADYVERTHTPKSGFRSTLKSLDTEERIDIYFYRRIGYAIALAAKWLHLTPNFITIFSIFVGVMAGVLFYPPLLGVNMLGILMLIFANTLDSADGQLARMTHNYSPLGRILDGMAGNLWFLAIYISICLRMNHYGTFFEHHHWIIWCLALTAGVSHSVQASMADYYRQLHLYSVNSRSELDSSASIRQRINSLSGLKRLIQRLYLTYTLRQERLTPQMQLLKAEFMQRYPDGDIPAAIRQRFRQGSLPLMKFANILTFNWRSFTLFAAILIEMPWLYFVIELTLGNLLLIYMMLRHERMCLRLHQGLDI